MVTRFWAQEAIALNEEENLEALLELGREWLAEGYTWKPQGVLKAAVDLAREGVTR